MQPMQRVRLTIGMSTPIKFFVTVVAVLLALGGIIFAAFAWGIGALSEHAGETLDSTSGPLGDNPFSQDPFGGDGMQSSTSLFSTVAKLFGLCGLPFVLIGIYLAVYTWRSAAWLDGTVVSKRGAFLTRSADLATADVRMGAIDHTRTHRTGVHEYRTVIRIPALVVVENGKTVKIPLRGQGLDLLPPNEMLALAGALARNTSVTAERARAIGAHLNDIAMDPLAA